MENLIVIMLIKYLKALLMEMQKINNQNSAINNIHIQSQGEIVTPNILKYISDDYSNLLSTRNWKIEVKKSDYLNTYHSIKLTRMLSNQNNNENIQNYRKIDTRDEKKI